MRLAEMRLKEICLVMETSVAIQQEIVKLILDYFEQLVVIAF